MQKTTDISTFTTQTNITQDFINYGADEIANCNGISDVAFAYVLTGDDETELLSLVYTAKQNDCIVFVEMDVRYPDEDTILSFYIRPPHAEWTDLHARVQDTDAFIETARYLVATTTDFDNVVYDYTLTGEDEDDIVTFHFTAMIAGEAVELGLEVNSDADNTLWVRRPAGENDDVPWFIVENV